jgi:hypothetical protein
MNWDSPEERFRLVERVGHAEYNRLHEEHLKESTMATVNGYRIRPVGSRFGRLFFIQGANVAYQTLEIAKEEAAKLPPLN